MLRCLHRFSKIFAPNFWNVSQQKCLYTTFQEIKNVMASDDPIFIAQYVPKYRETEKSGWEVKFDFELNYSGKTPDEMVKEFENLSYFCAQTEAHIAEEQFDSIIRSVIEKLPDMTDEEIMKILVDLRRFPLIKSPRDRNFSDLWNALDNECWTRSQNWRCEDLLRALNAWHKLGITKASNFNFKALIKMAKYIEKLSSRMFVELMFYQTQMISKDMPMYNAEARFYKVFHELSIDDIGVVCLAFVKSEKKFLNNPLVNGIYKKLVKEIETVRDRTLVNILISLKYSSKPYHVSFMNEFFDKVLPHMDRLNLKGHLNIAILGMNLQNCHEPLIEKVVEKFNKEISKARLSDLERITSAIAMFDFKSKQGVEIEFMKSIIVELKKRVHEIVFHPRSFVSTVHNLAVMGIYDLELIESILKESFLTFTYGKGVMNISREVLWLDIFTKINLEGTYTGPVLDEKTRAIVARFNSLYIPYRGQPYKITHTDSFLLDLKDFTELKYGKNVLTQVLPQYERADVIFCFDESGKSVTSELLDLFPASNFFTGNPYSKHFLLSQKQPFADNMDKYQMISIIAAGWNDYLRDSQRPTGNLRMKMEQLKMIGFKPVLVLWHDWMSNPPDVREQIVISKINEALEK